MKTTRKVLWGFVLISFFLGACLVGAGIALGGKLHNGFGLHYIDREDSIFSTGETKITQIEDFSSLSIDISIGDIEIKKGNSYKLEIKNIPEDEYDVTNENDTLLLHSTTEHRWNLNDIQQDYKITLTIPRDKELEDVVIYSRMGDIDIDDLIMSSLQITQDMGDIEVEDVIVNGDSELTNHMGDIQFSGKPLGYTTLHTSMGDIEMEIKEKEDSYFYELTTSMGDIKVNGKTLRDGLGSSVKNGDQGSAYTMEADSSMGDIKVEFLK